MKIQSYIAAVAAQLADLPGPLRRQVIDELGAILAEGVTPEDLGPAEAYAAELRADLLPESDPADAEGDVLGFFPYETRGATEAGVRSRIWAPQDPRVIVPRLMGIGWTVNLGAVAVRLGLLRPDDWDEQSHEQVPSAMVAVWRGLPAVFAATAISAAVVASRRGRPVPTRWRGGIPADWVDARWTAAPAAVAASAALWGALPATGDDRFLRPALAGYAAALGAGMAAAMTVARKDAGPQRGVMLGSLAVPVAVLVAMVAAPVTVAVRRNWSGKDARP